MMRNANPFPASPSSSGTHRMGERDVYLVIALPCLQVLTPGVFPSDEAWVNLSLHSRTESCLKCTYKHLVQAQRCERQLSHRQHVPHVHMHRHNGTHHPKSEHIASSQSPHGTFFPEKRDNPFFGMASQTHASSWKPSFCLSRLPHHTQLLMKLHHFQTKQLFTLY